MAFDFKTFEIDETLELEGVWEDLGDGSALLIARTGNSRNVKAYQTLPAGIRRMIETGKLDEKQSVDILCNITAKTILLDWKGMEALGKEVKYSVEMAKKMLVDLPEFRRFVIDIADDAERYHTAEQDITAKNSKTA